MNPASLTSGPLAAGLYADMPPHRDAFGVNILICCDSFYGGNAVGCDRSRQ